MKLINKKKFCLQSILAVAIVAICVLLLPMSAKADTPGTVTDNNVNVRSQADVGSTSLGKVNSGDKVTIVEEVTNASGDLWYKVTTAAGQTGYIKADLVSKSTTTTTTTTTDNNNNNNNNNNTTTTTTTTTNVTNIDAKAAYISGDVVNIRSQASASSDLVAKANKNSEVTVTGETTASDGYKWYKVTFTADGATKTGFIRSDLLTFTKPTNKPAETNIDSKPAETTTETPDTTTETPDEPETTEVPEETPAEEPAAPVETEPKRMVTPIQPYEDPEVVPEGFTEAALESGIKVWNKGDYFLLYGVNEKEVTGWYIVDEKNSTYVSAEGLFEAGKAKKSEAGEIFGINIKVILVILIVLVIILLGVVFFMALKLSRGVEDDDDYEYDDYEDEEEEEIPVSNIENSRSSRSSRASANVEREPKQSKASKAKDKFLNYFTTEVDEEADDEYYDDVDDDDDDIDFIDI